MSKESRTRTASSAATAGMGSTSITDSSPTTIVEGRVSDVQILITRIELKDLKNTGSILDPQDPCVHIQIGGATHQSKRKTDAGTAATFDEEIALDVTDDEVEGTMILEVFNEHVSGTKKHVGVGTIKIKDALTSKNKVITFVLPLSFHNKDKETLRGTATVTAQIVDNRSVFWPPAAPTSVDTRTTDLQMVISSIVLKDLKDTGSIIDPQDPCVHIQIGGAIYKSKRKTDAGTSATFNEEITLDITDGELEGVMVIEVFNEHVTGSKKHVGVGAIKIRTALPDLKKVQTFTVPLTYKNKDKETQRGSASVTAQVIDNRIVICGCPIS